MESESLWTIFINASLVNNFVLAYFLGICPFLGVSSKLETATRMGGAVTFVMLVSSVCAFGIQLLLVAIDAPYLKLISFIAVFDTASTGHIPSTWTNTGFSFQRPLMNSSVLLLLAAAISYSSPCKSSP
jgi:hypothetical protein